MTRAPKRLTDGIISAESGVDSGKTPTLATQLNPLGLTRNQLAWLTNGTVRGGKIKPRLAYHKIDIGEFEDSGGKFQGAEFYKPDGGEGVLVACINGHVYKFNVGTDNSVQDITITGDPNPSVRPRVWFYQAEQFLVMQDGQTKPFIYSGGTARRADVDEVPVGTVGAYGNGRIWQVLANQTTFAAGDLAYSITGKRDDVLGFTDNLFLNGGGAFAVPVNAGAINAMKFVMNLDTSLGQGPLQCFTANTIFSVNAPFDRTQWQNLSYPIQTISMVNYGALAQDSTVLVNGDVFYRAPDGIRSYIIARRDFGMWGNTPISTEVDRIIKFDNTPLLSYSSGIVFDNRLLVTCSPFSTVNGVAHRGLLPLDFNPISSMRQRSDPAWEGVWTGLNILKVVKGDFSGGERAFMFVSNAGEIELWEIKIGQKFDNNLLGDIRIQWEVETASYPFNSPFDLKRLQSGDLWIDNLTGETDFELAYRPDGYPCYIPWTTWSDCAAYQDCEVEGCSPQTFKPQYRPKRKFPRPDDTACDPILGKPYVDLFECQAKLAISGYCEIKQLRLHATEREESEFDPC